MAKKSFVRAHKEVENHSRQQETVSDEISLRDEILHLKRQILILKRTNDQYAVRLRKYEDEAKRKDKQLEQLMNPRKNADVAKILSSKGAAILMTLRDQNNALIQMLLNRDLHIRRLVAEVKMSKLYASTKRNEYYKAEINRLRNLLAKSEEALKENIEEQQEQIKSICVSEKPIPEISSASDQSSPRDMEELRSTILSLESNIKYSNDLLAQKNRQISILSDEVNFLRKYFRYKTYKAEAFDCEKLPKKVLTRSWPGPLDSDTLSTQDLLRSPERHRPNERRHCSPSAPLRSARPTADPRGSGPKTAETLPDGSHSPPLAPDEPLLHQMVPDDRKMVLEEEKILSSVTKDATARSKGKWKRAFTRYKEFKKLQPQPTTNVNKNRNVIFPKMLDLKIEEPQILDNDFQKKTSDGGKNLHSDEKLKSKDVLERSQHFSDNELNSDIFHTFQHFSSNFNHARDCSTAEEPQHVNKETRELYTSSSSSSSAQEELKTSTTIDFQHSKSKEKKSLRDVYRQSLDSSFESENSYSTTQGVRQVQVEVQINSVSLQNYSEHSENRSEYGKANKTNNVHEESPQRKDFPFETEFNDDDDVIIC